MTSLVERIRTQLSRVTGVSTPFGGISWGSGDRESSSRSDALVYTPAKCADVLSVDERTIIALLESGDLHGFRVAGEWRMTANQISDFLREQSEAQEFEVFVQKVSDPRVWVASLQKEPDLLREIQTREYPENSFGRFLQEALEESGEDAASE